MAVEVSKFLESREDRPEGEWIRTSVEIVGWGAIS